METVPDNNQVDKMVATNNNIPTKRALLEERKKQLEKELAEHNQKLSDLCSQEAELTGIIPPETPLEATEALQLLRKQSGIYDDNTLKRRHKTECQEHKIQANTLNHNFVDDKNVYEHIRQKKKQHRVPSSEEGANSITSNEQYSKQKYAHSLKSNLNLLSPTDTYPETKYPSPTYRQYRNSENIHYQYSRPEDVLCSGFYKLSFNGYNDYVERNEKLNNLPHYSPTYNYMHSSYNSPVQMAQHLSLQHNAHQTNLRLSQHSPQSSHSPQHAQHSSLSQLPYSPYNSPSQSTNSPLMPHHTIGFSRVQQRLNQPPQTMQNIQASRHGSPTKLGSSNNMVKPHYYNNYTIYRESMQNRRNSPDSNLYRVLSGDVGFKTHNLQPHQQYEHVGLGGYWKRAENGEMLWVYSSNTIDSNWQRDKRFGSLDRRRNKKLQRRISPGDKAATLGPMPNHKNQVAFIKISEIPNRKSDDHRQLVRTQSLGSVGQNIDCVYLSDDTSSFESDNKNIADNRAAKRQKEREWFETSLDGPVVPTSHIVPPRSQSVISSPLAPEDKYLFHGETPTPQVPHNLYATVNLSTQQKVQYSVPQSLSPPIRSRNSPKIPLEIPAESNPSYRVPEPLNIKKLNNNIPKNCTIVQAGVCKPYYEETKPFEMSDFYKYSTKFKKSPQKQNNSHEGNRILEPNGAATPLTNFNIPSNVEIPFINQSNRESTLNASINLTDISVSQHFSDEMNAWYNDQDSEGNTSLPENRSSATLV